VQKEVKLGTRTLIMVSLNTFYCYPSNLNSNTPLISFHVGTKRTTEKAVWGGRRTIQSWTKCQRLGIIQRENM